LRKDQTYTEAIVWSQVRNHQMEGLKFYRQYGCGPYVLDFYCPALQLAIEVDGPDHFTTDGVYHDALRTAYLNSHSIRVIRFTNEQVMGNPNAVCARIRSEVLNRRDAIEASRNNRQTPT
jgi:very-short-patch-repair endonuclease